MASQVNRPNRAPYIIAIIGAIATIIAGILAGPLVLKLFDSTSTKIELLSVRVTNPDADSIQGARVLLFFQGGPLSQLTDGTGATTFSVPVKETLNTRVVVEANQFEIFEQDVNVPLNKTLDIRLTPQSGNAGSIIYRAVDGLNSQPITGAEIILLANGDIFRQVSDSNGLAKFTITFPATGLLDAEISVNTKNYQISNQRVTLTPNAVQDVRLNPSDQTVALTGVTPAAGTPIQNTSPSENIPTQGTAGGVANNKNGVTATVTRSSLVDESGFKVVVEGSASAQDKAELQIIIASPNNEPFVGTYVAIHEQKTDVNNQPVQGNRVAEMRTDNTGSAQVTINPGTYGIWPDIRGYSWPELNFNQEIVAGKRTTITIVPSRLIVVARLADNTLVPGSYTNIATEKVDVNGQSLEDQRVMEMRFRDTGEVQFDLTPGSYKLYIEVARGEDWGTLNNILLPATLVKYEMKLGRIRLEARDANGNVVNGFYGAVFLQKKDANNKIIAGTKVLECRTDNTGACNLDLTPGVYFIQSDAGIVENIEVQSGQIAVLENTDFIKP